MEVTIDKFGRILIPKKLRKLLGLHPGQKIQLIANQEERRLALRLPSDPNLLEIHISNSGLPVIQNGQTNSDTFDTVEFIKSTREEFLDKKMGLE